MNNKYIRKFAVGFSFFGFSYMSMLFGRMLEEGSKNILMTITSFVTMILFAVLLHVCIAIDTAESLKNK